MGGKSHLSFLIPYRDIKKDIWVLAKKAEWDNFDEVAGFLFPNQHEDMFHPEASSAKVERPRESSKPLSLDRVFDSVTLLG